jgi:hypothetical protein
MTKQFPRRIVAWTDGSAEALNAAGWAARHAAARGVPLHVVLHQPTGAVLIAPGGPPGTRPTRETSTSDPAVLTHEIRRIRSQHHDLTMSVEMIAGDREHTEIPALVPGDVLVTGPDDFRRLSEAAASAVTTPIVVVPDQAAARNAQHHILLLAGDRLTPAGAAFAFDTARDLGTALDVIRMAPQGAAFGDDYWIESRRTGYLTESRLEADLSRFRARFPTVPGAFSTLRTRPWATLRAMTRSAFLVVLDQADTDRDPRRVLELSACPVAILP